MHNLDYSVAKSLPYCCLPDRTVVGKMHYSGGGKREGCPSMEKVGSSRGRTHIVDVQVRTGAPPSPPHE